MKIFETVNRIKSKYTIKKTTALTLCLCLMFSSAMASVYGGESIGSFEYNVAEGTKYVHNQVMSSQSGVGKQTENYYIYKPNDGIVPKLVCDDYLWGKITASSMMKNIINNGYYPIMLMNGDFFSFETGVPMGHQLIDGEILSKDSSTQDSLGYTTDGEAFIAPLWIETTVTVNGEPIVIENINKYRQPYSTYLLTERFSSETHATTPGYNIIIGQLSGKMELEKEITGVVEDIVSTDQSLAIEPGKIIITADDTAPMEKYMPLGKFQVGDEVTILNHATGDERWSDCLWVQGSVGGQILKDGQVVDKDEAAAPRTAVGIKENGEIIFYTVDGRQNGYSYGVRLKTLAERLKELGCTDAINMDGGGSTTLVGKYPGKTESELLNKPSGGSERKVTSFFALYNTREPTGDISKLHIYPQGGNYLTGTRETFSAYATDTADHPVSISGKVEYSVQGGSIVENGGKILLNGSGEVEIMAEADGVQGKTKVNVFSTPDDITVFEGSKQLDVIRVSANETRDFWARAWVGNKVLNADASCFTWTLTNTKGILGEINNDGVFTAGDVSAQGEIHITAGNKTVSIPVYVSGNKEDEYTEGEFFKDEVSLVLAMENAHGIEVDKENIFAYCDSEPVDFEYEENKVIVALPEDEKMHKIKIVVTNDFERTSMFSYSIGSASAENVYTDTNNHWAYDYIMYMSGQKIVRGVQNDDLTYSFNPGNNMTRAEFAVMISNYLKQDAENYKYTELDFSDSDSIPSWAEPAIKVLYSQGIMNGKTYSDDDIRFDSYSTITRAEVATVLYRLMNLSDDRVDLTFEDKEDIPQYASDAFKTLVSFKIIGGYEDNTLKPNNNITRAEAVKLLYGIY